VLNTEKGRSKREKGEKNNRRENGEKNLRK
jgi:hypothetical protein